VKVGLEKAQAREVEKSLSAGTEEKIVRDNDFLWARAHFLSVSKSTLCPIRDAKVKMVHNLKKAGPPLAKECGN
jgi:hypothetical protein